MSQRCHSDAEPFLIRKHVLESGLPFHALEVELHEIERMGEVVIRDTIIVLRYC